MAQVMGSFSLASAVVPPVRPTGGRPSRRPSASLRRGAEDPTHFGSSVSWTSGAQVDPGCFFFDCVFWVANGIPGQNIQEFGRRWDICGVVTALFRDMINYAHS